MFSYIGRQPLYSKDYALYGYDILHRDNVTKRSKQFADEDEMLRALFSEAISVYDLQELTEGLPAHFTFTKNLLMSNLPYMVSPERLVVEISTDNPVDSALTDKLNELKLAGYKLTLSGYNPRSTGLRYNKILNLFDFVYVNIAQHNRLQLQEMMGKIRQNTNARLLAEQVDSEADFDKASGLPFTLFQGLLFGKPSVLKKEVNLGTTPYGLLYNELSGPRADFERCITMLTEQPILTHMFLQGTPAPKELASAPQEIRRHLMTMGMGRLRKWSILLLLKQMNVNDTAELSARAYRRGLFVERLMDESGTKADSSNGFYMGAFSLMDQVTDTPLESILSQLRVDRELRGALLGKEENIYASFLKWAAAFEETGEVPTVSGVRLSLNKTQADKLLQSCQDQTDAAFSCLNPFLNKNVRR